MCSVLLLRPVFLVSNTPKKLIAETNIRELTACPFFREFWGLRSSSEPSGHLG